MPLLTRILMLPSTLLVVVALCACTEQTTPVFADPVPLTLPAGKPALGPRLTQSTTDDAILSWMEPEKDTTSLRFSIFELGDFEAATTVTKDEQMFVNWADLPSVSKVGAKSLFAHWLSYTAGETYSYQVLTTLSHDNGATWSTPLPPHTDGTDTEHGFVSSYPVGDSVGLLWLDGRETPADGMTLRGATLDPNGALDNEQLLDELVCDCCQTDVAITKDGPIAVYRNRTEDEVRDIYVSRHVNGQWQPGVPVSDDGWVISGCPVNGPSIAADGDRVVIAWFTAADNQPRVKVAVSTNGGAKFSEPLDIASKSALGRVGIAMIDRHVAAVTWLESDKKGTYSIQLRGLTFDGQLGDVETVGRTNLSRSVPQMVRVEDELILAWTDEMKDVSKIAAVRVRILGFYD